MKKIVAWFVSKTKFGKTFGKAQSALDGYKAYLAGAALMIPGLLKLIIDIQERGLPAFTELGENPNYRMMLEGWAIIATRAAIAKTQRVTEVAAAESTVAAEKK